MIFERLLWLWKKGYSGVGGGGSKVTKVAAVEEM
jgi:hypothetical protein